MKTLLTLLMITTFASSAMAATRCKTDWNGAYVCTDTGSGRVIMRCTEDWNGATVCK